jgi:hypothetical protein
LSEETAVKTAVKKRHKSNAGWLVVREQDGLLTNLYFGPDRKKARAAVEAHVGISPISVLRVARTVIFTDADLEPRLVKKF